MGGLKPPTSLGTWVPCCKALRIKESSCDVMGLDCIEGIEPPTSFGIFVPRGKALHLKGSIVDILAP